MTKNIYVMLDILFSRYANAHPLINNVVKKLNGIYILVDF